MARAAIAGAGDGTRASFEAYVFDAFYTVYGREDPRAVVLLLVSDLLSLIREWGEVPTGGDVLRFQMRVMESHDYVGRRGLLDELRAAMRADDFMRHRATIEEALRVVFC